MNPDTNEFEMLHRENAEELKNIVGQATKASPTSLLRPDGSSVPDHWAVFTVGENVAVKGYTFKVAHINESTLILEPVGPVIVGEEDSDV